MQKNLLTSALLATALFVISAAATGLARARRIHPAAELALNRISKKSYRQRRRCVGCWPHPARVP